MTAITLLDGGLGQELIHRAPEAPTKLWATQVMADHPELVTAVHADYFAAGASIATANTYALHHDRFTGTPFEGRQAQLVAQAPRCLQRLVRAPGSGGCSTTIRLVDRSKPPISPAR